MILNYSSQELFKNNLSCLAENYLDKCSNVTIKTFHYIHSLSLSCNSVFPLQQTIADNVQCSVSTVKRSLKELVARGIIIKCKRRFNRSNIYYLNPSLHVGEVKEKLTKFFHNFFKNASLDVALYLSHQSCLPKNELISKNYMNLHGLLVNLVIGRRTQKKNRFLDALSSITTIFKKDKKTERKEHEMNQMLPIDIINAIEKRLPLTEHGRINLQKYPFEALRHAQSQLKTIVEKNEPFIYLLSVCERFCAKNQLYINRAAYDRERHLRKIDKQDRNFVDQDLFERINQSKPKSSARVRPEFGSTGRQPLFIPQERPELEPTDVARQVLEMPATNDFMSFVQGLFKAQLENSTV